MINIYTYTYDLYAAYLLCCKEMFLFSLNTMDINKRYSSGIWIQKWRFFQPKWFWFFVSVPTERSCAKINTKIPRNCSVTDANISVHTPSEFSRKCVLLFKLKLYKLRNCDNDPTHICKIPWMANLPNLYFEIDSKIQKVLIKTRIWEDNKGLFESQQHEK